MYLVQSSKQCDPAITDNLSLNSISGNLRAQDGGPKALVKFVSAARRGPGSEIGDVRVRPNWSIGDDRAGIPS